MRITDLRLEAQGDVRRATAQIHWEQTARAPDTLMVAMAGRFADQLQAQPEAFALACLPFAAWSGERRLWIEASLCPQLRDGMQALVELWAEQHHLKGDLAIEAEGGWRPAQRHHGTHTAAFLSGGVDSLSALHANRRQHRRSDPEAIKFCLFIYGLNAGQMHLDGPDPDRWRFHQAHGHRLQQLAQEAGATILPLTTNVRRLCPSYACWTRIGYAPATAATAHLLARLTGRVLLAADGESLAQSQELREVPLMGSAAVELVLEEAGVPRESKLRALASWPAAMEQIQVCHLITLPSNGRLNCGLCEKCLRTKLILLTLGLPVRAEIFAETGVSGWALLRLPVVTTRKLELWSQLPQLLKQQGRYGLALVLAARLWIARLRLLISPARW